MTTRPSKFGGFADPGRRRTAGGAPPPMAVALGSEEISALRHAFEAHLSLDIDGHHRVVLDEFYGVFLS